MKQLKYHSDSLFKILDKDTLPFSVEDYSKFKYGNTEIANAFGRELAFYFFYCDYFSNLIKNNCHIIVYSSPYSYIPTASLFLTNSFIKELRELLLRNGYSDIKVRFGKINRCNTYSEDYGSMSASERLNLISKDTYELYDLPLNRELCIFIDDISITGTHQFVVEKLCDTHAIDNDCIFLYYAKLHNTQIPPTFENILNFSYVNSIDKLADVILSDNFQLTTRTAKRILQFDDIDFVDFIRKISITKPSFAGELYHSALENKYHLVDAYIKNLDKLKYFK